MPRIDVHRISESFGERLAIILRALLIALVLAAAKIVVHRLDWEPVQTLPLLTALMGGVVFTLAILLASTLQDFKESERIVGELGSQLRRLRQDIPFVFRDPRSRDEALLHARNLARSLNDQFRQGVVWDGDRHRTYVRNLDRLLLGALLGGAPQAQTRTIQVALVNTERILDRLGIIMQTTFTRAGYYLAGFVVLIALGTLLVTRIEPFWQGVFLFGFSGFLMVGLFLLIRDLDNPFADYAKISTHQMQEAEAELSEPYPA